MIIPMRIRYVIIVPKFQTHPANLITQPARIHHLRLCFPVSFLRSELQSYLSIKNNSPIDFFTDTPPPEKSSHNGFLKGRSSEKRLSSKAACKPPSRHSSICIKESTPVRSPHYPFPILGM